MSLLVGLALSFPAWADTGVPAGESLVITNSEALGIGNIQLGSDSSLVFGGASAGSAGLNEYTRAGAASLGTPNSAAYGTWTRITTDAYWAVDTVTATTTEYIYTGRWHIPADGLYSVYEHIDDTALIAIDGRTVLQNGSYNTPTCVRDIALTAGWHDLELRLYNGASTGGRFSPELASGFLFSPSNDLISVANQTNAFPFADPGDGSVLLSVHNGGLFQKIFVAGEAAFDLTQHGTDVPLALTGSLYPAAGAASAKVTVSGGTGELLFGTPNQTVQFTPFNADIAFTGVADPVGVTFRDYSTVVAWPTSCAWRVANNATVALYGTNMLGAGDVTLTHHNIYALSRTAVANDATIRVQGTNLTAALKPCTLDATGWWSGANVTLTNDIALEGVNPTALLPINVDMTLQGKITGTGTVSKTGTARCEIREACDFVGPVSVSDSGILAIDASTAGASNNAVTLGAGSTLALYPSGAGTADTAAWINSLRGGGSTARLFLPARQTMTVDVLDGALTVQGSGSTLRVNTLGTNATLSVIGQTAVVLGAASPGATLSLDNGCSLSPSGDSVALDALNVVSGSASVSGAFTVNLLGGGGKLVKQGAETLTVRFCGNTSGIQVDAGHVQLAPPAFSSVLGSLPALWLDASASNVFTQYKSYTYSNNWPNIERWNDCRPGAPAYGYNGRGEDYCQTYPYVMSNALNGQPVVSFGVYQMPIYPPYVRPGDGSGTEARRLPLSTNVPVQYAVLVFGSQNGGGVSVLGGDDLRRPGSTTNHFRSAATPILASPNYPVWTNGVAVTATNTGFTGGYQILSLNAKGTSLNALGWRVDNNTAGGQIFGEVLLYTNALTTLQRMTAEAYLAAKWCLPYGLATLPAATVAAGASLEVGDLFTVGRLYGSGTVTASAALAPLDLSGVFNGTLALNGGSVVIADLPAPPTAADIPTSGLTGWFDPSLTNRVVLGGKYTPTRPLAVAALVDRTTTNRFLLGTSNTDSTYDRRPWLSVTNNPLGETLYWVDYTNRYGDSNGNTLRLYSNPAYIGTADTGHLTPTNVQTGFIVLDSSRGGGVPITRDVNATQVFTRNDPSSIASPIWGANTSTALKNGLTFLDGVSVNGASRGYNGTAEVLSFVATNVLQAAFFGWYGGDGSPDGNRNRERLGEILLFETALADDARALTEDYLMRKWLGRTRAAYSDLSAASVSGSGSVSASQPDKLPSFGAGFTGTVALSGGAFAFTLSTNALGQATSAPATAIPGALSVSAAGTVTVHFGFRPPAGTYTLMSYGSVTGGGFAGWSLATTGSTPAGPVQLKQTGTALTILIVPQGTLIQVL
jgi:hypothetical protein